MIDVGSVSLNRQSSVRDAIEVLEKSSAQVALVVSDSGQLLGVITDGDIRRGLLAGLGLDSAAVKVMNASFHSLPEGSSSREALALMRLKGIRHVPVVRPDGSVKSIHALSDFVRPHSRDHRVVIMAGGMGRRLRPLTDTVPKPMLPVGGRPMLESVVEQCRQAGLTEITIAVNYRAEMIMSYFGDGSQWQVRIDYLVEDEPLGTAGALGLLTQTPADPFLVLNADVLTRANLGKLIEFHRDGAWDATICVREHLTEIPFGVVSSHDGRLLSFREKPTISHFISAGIYMLNPSVLDFVVRHERIDMPALLSRVLSAGEIGVFALHEYWLDAGHPSSLARANDEWQMLADDSWTNER